MSKIKWLTHVTKPLTCVSVFLIEFCSILCSIIKHQTSLKFQQNSGYSHNR